MGMVSSTLQRAVAEMSRDERVELRDFIDITLGSEFSVLTEEQESIVRQRAAQMEADPTFGTLWEDVHVDLLADLQ